MPEQEKSRQPKAVVVELRADGDPNRSEKPGWSAGDMDKLPRKLIRHPLSPKGVSGLTTIFMTWPKSAAAIQEAAIP